MSACGCCNASISSNAARFSVSDDDKISILNCFGKNFTVSHTRVAAVFVTYISRICNGVVIYQCTIQVCRVLPRCFVYLVVQRLPLSFQVDLIVLCFNQSSH